MKFLVIGDSGTGDRYQYEVAATIVEARKRFPVRASRSCWATTCTAASGRNDYVKKFEQPYKPLLDAGVKFYASLGNHDEPTQRFYEPFNMDGKRYYTFKQEGRGVLRARQQLHDAGAARMAEDASSSARMRSGRFRTSTTRSIPRATGTVRSAICRCWSSRSSSQNGVDVVFAGHEHFYERLKPQKGIIYITQGGAAKLRRGNIKRQLPDDREGLRHRPIVHDCRDHRATRCSSRRSRGRARSSTRDRAASGSG